MRNNPLRRVRKVEDKQLHDAGSMAGALGTRSVEDGGADGVTFIDQAWVADGVRALARQINPFRNWVEGPLLRTVDLGLARGLSQRLGHLGSQISLQGVEILGAGNGCGLRSLEFVLTILFGFLTDRSSLGVSNVETNPQMGRDSGNIPVIRVDDDPGESSQGSSEFIGEGGVAVSICLLYTSPSPRD